MVARLIKSTDPIDVKQLCVLLYGQPGSRKTSLAQTASNPITLATDPGIYRAYGRKLAIDVETWSDVLEACAMPEVLSADTIVIDTLGMLLDKLALMIAGENPKNGNRMGGLSLQGYGVLKSQFAQWANTMKAKGKDLLFICHEKAEKVGDQPYYMPEIVGGSYSTIMNIADAVGYLHFDGGKKVVDFAPTDRWMAKVPPCGWGQIALPDFAHEPGFLAKLMAEAKSSMGRISGESARLAKVVEEWQADVRACHDAATLSARLLGLAALPEVSKRQVWAMILQEAQKKGWTFDKASKSFKDPKPAGAEPAPASPDASQAPQAEPAATEPEERDGPMAEDDAKPAPAKKGGRKAGAA